MSQADDPTPDPTPDSTPPEEPDPDPASIEGPKGGPRRLLIAGAVAAVVFVALVVATRGDDAGGGCVADLTEHLWDDVGVVSGSDLGRAEDAGLAFGSVDDLVDASVETSFQPDPLSGRVLQQLGAEEPEEVAGYAADDVRCWIGDEAGSFVAEGDFDADQVAEGEVADDVAVDGELLAYDRDGDAEGWLAASGGADTPVGGAVAELDDMGALTFSGVPSPGDEDELLWIGLGLAGDEDDWELVAVWAFEDDDAAESSVDTIVGAVEEGEVPSMIEGDVADLIERDGPLLTLQAPMRVEPSEWRTPFVQLDPMFAALSDLNGLGTGDDDDSGDDSSDDGDSSDSDDSDDDSGG